MDLKQLDWVGPFTDISGYGNCDRHYIISLINSGKIDLGVHGISFESEKVELKTTEIIKKHYKLCFDAPVRVIHSTPENFTAFMGPDCYNIGYTAWETTSLPYHWVSECNRMNEIWVPSQWNVEVFQKSGVTVPIFCIPHIVPFSEDISVLPSFNYPGDSPDFFWFYSIFQWTVRKNYEGLLTAFYTEFMNQNDVTLAIKTYRRDSSASEITIIKNDIMNIKKELNLPRYPNIFLFPKFLNREELYQFHNRGDCFVFPTRGEGWGIPIAEAMLCGKPVIVPNYGGQKDFVNKENSILVSSREVPVSGMTWMPVYNGTMLWGEPDIMELRKAMRWVFNNREKAKKIGQRAQQDIKNNYSYEKISKLMIDRIEVLYREHSWK